MRHKYTSIEDGGVIDISAAISQSVQTLELASAIATDAKDVDALLQISSSWLDFGERLMTILDNIDEEDVGDESPKTKDGKPYGFTNHVDISKGEEEDDGESKG